MENVNIIGATENKVLVALRHNVAEASRSAYGANVEYAAELNVVFSGFDWFELSHTDTSAEGKAVAAEKAELFKELKAVNHSNCSKVWADIRKYARLAKYPKPDTETGEGVQQGEQGESGANHARSPMLRNIEELTALYKFNARQVDLDSKIRKAQLKIGEALTMLGIDLNMVNAK